MIAVCDYGAGNLRSVANTLEELGAQFQIVRAAGPLHRASKVILPGVGHFGQMMRALAQLGIRESLIEMARRGVPLLGICLGLHALFEGSEEAPELAGFSLFPGLVRRFPGGLRVPHMGWNSLEPKKPCRLLAGLRPNPYFYFAHSYYVPVGGYTAAACLYGEPFTALLEQDNLFGVQFHPEKSGPSGLRVVQNFIEL